MPEQGSIWVLSQITQASSDRGLIMQSIIVDKAMSTTLHQGLLECLPSRNGKPAQCSISNMLGIRYYDRTHGRIDKIFDALLP